MIIVSGPSCVGKSSLIDYLIQNHDYTTIVPYTTRTKRTSEINHWDYHFVSVAEIKGISNNFSEGYWSCHICNNWYGYSTEIDKLIMNDKVIIHAESNLAIKIKKKYPEYVKLVFLDFKTQKEMKKKLWFHSAHDKEYTDRLSYNFKEQHNKSYFDFIFCADKPKEFFREFVRDICYF